MAHLVISHLQYRFGRHQVLRDINLTVRNGECVVLFGANGAGKSTLLALLSTRLKSASGDYVMDGISSGKDNETLRERIVFIGHNTHLYGHLTALENLRFFKDIRGLDFSESQILEAVDAVGLLRFASRPVAGFSAGMKKRLALARVALVNPPLLLLDEPYSALDPEGVASLNAHLLGYLQQGGSIVMASHDPERVAALPHRAFHLMEGRLIPEEKIQSG